MPETLAQKVRAKYPGAYDDLSDQELEAKVKAKYPGAYDDLPTTGSGRSWVDSAVDFVKGAASVLNPAPLVQALSAGPQNKEEAAVFAGHGQEGLAAYRLTRGVIGAQAQQGKQAIRAAREGRYAEAVGHGGAALLPLVGPAAAEAGETISAGEYAKGAGKAAALIAPSVLKYGVEATRAGSAVPTAGKVAKAAPLEVRGRVVPANPNPVEAMAVDFGAERGIPLDAATATGNPVVRGVQFLADRSIGGGFIANKARQAQADAFTRVGYELANEAHPRAVTAEQAGQSVRDAVAGKVREHHAEANRAYGELRDLEGALPSAPNRGPSVNLTPAEMREVKRIRAELDAVDYEQGGLVRGESGFKDTYVARSANAPVYHDILQAAPGTADITAGEMRTAIDAMLAGKKPTNAAIGAIEVARARLSGQPTVGLGHKVSAPFLEEGAGSEVAPMMVDLRGAKIALKPMYQRMVHQLPITQQRSSPGLKALENVVNGPDLAPLSQVDTDLGTIKGIARGADLPELRDMSKGLAAGAIKVLDQAVWRAAGEGGPAAVDALRRGRAATVAKYNAADVLKEMREEPVQAFGQATWARDAGIDRLRRVAKLVPGEMGKIGRAYLEDLMTQATAQGAFDRAQGLWARWQNLGPQTKQVLFRDPDLVRNLDQFFLLAKKTAENPNPSGTAYVASIGAQGAYIFTNPVTGGLVEIGAAGLSKLLHSPKTVRMLVRGLRLPVNAKPAAAVMADELLRVASEQGAIRAVASDEGQGPNRDRE